MDEKLRTDDRLFETLAKEKKKRRRRTVRTVAITVAVIAAALVTAVIVLQRRVQDRFSRFDEDVLTFAAAKGSISTTVSGSGQLADVDVETVSVPDGVEIDEVLVEVNDAVDEGDVLATVDMSSVMSAMAALQKELEELDTQLNEAADDEVSDTVKAGVTGRVKTVFAAEGDSVASCMVEHGALAVLSMDGYMAADIGAEALAPGDAVTVETGDGTRYEGTVERVYGGVATVLIADDGPAPDDEAVVYAADGETELGRGPLYIHAPLRLTGFAGTIGSVRVSAGDRVGPDTTVFTLRDTAYSANYDAILRRRAEKEEDMLALLALYEDGAVRAPFGGMVVSVDHTEESGAESGAGSGSDMAALAAMAGMADRTAAAASDGTQVVTLSPERQVSVTVSVDESDILALALGQEAEVVISSLDDAAFTGEVTEIDRSSSAAGQYSAVITLDKDSSMLTGMSAKVNVKIEGSEDAIYIPVDALHHTSTTAYVYTAYDEKTQEYGGMVEVTEGMSNDDYVEIVSGLAEGDVVYYVEARSFSFFPFYGGYEGYDGDFGGYPYGGWD